MDYGYVRVSSTTQNPDRQIRELLKNGISYKNIFVEKFTGKTVKRPKFQMLLKKIRNGDHIYVTSFDRLGRNYDETLEAWTYITKQKKAKVVILDLPLLDSKSKVGEETGKLISDILIYLMAYMADMERKKNREAQRMGIEAKKARGEWNEYGRPRKVSEECFEKYYAQYSSGKITLEECIKILDISDSTFRRYENKLKSQKENKI